MNSRTLFALLAILATVGSPTMSSAYADVGAPQTCIGCTEAESRAMANEMLIDSIPISVWTDKTDYSHSDMIMVKGKVANPSEFHITVRVTSPLNSVVHVDQITTADDGSFETALNTAGSLWKYDGTYIIKVNYGSAEKSNSVKVELTGGVKYVPEYDTPGIDKQCSDNEVSARVDSVPLDSYCIPYSISDGMITGAMINTNDNSIVINVNAENGGTLTINPAMTVQKGIFMALVDGEEANDYEIIDNSITVVFPAGTEQIEMIGTWVIPEFGAIAAMILAVAIVAIIAVSAKSRLSIMPRY